MKEFSKTDNILNRYILTDSENSKISEHLLTQQLVNNKLKIVVKNQRNFPKKNPLKKYCHNTSSYIKKPSKYNSLIKAIENNDIRKVKDLLNQDISNINLLNKNGISPLHIAVINGNLDIINYILDKGANPNISSLHKKQTPLHYAYIFKNIKSSKIRNLLLKYNANPDLEDINNKKPNEYSLKYKESSEVDNYTSSNEIENENSELNLSDKNKIIIGRNNQYSDNENNNKNTYSISESEATIVQQETQRSNLYNIEDLINSDKNKYNTEKIKILSKKSRKNNSKYYRKINKENKTVSSNKNILLSSKEKDTFSDSLEINKNNYSNKTHNNSLNHIKLKSRKSNKNTCPKNIKLNKNFLLKSSPIEKNTFKSENIKKEININKQYFINNEFFTNYYNDKEYFKSKIAKKLFKMPKKDQKNMSSGKMTSSMQSTDIQTSKKIKSNIVINNNVTEFIYTEDNNETKDLQKLKNWLDSLQLSCYYNNFVNNNITDINKLINDYKTNRENINYQFIENLLNIHISGHVYRILCKLEIDSSFVENKISTFLFGLNCSNNENNSKKNYQKFLFKLMIVQINAMIAVILKM